MEKISAAIRQRAARIKLFLCDVDGVLTNGVLFSLVGTSRCDVPVAERSVRRRNESWQNESVHSFVGSV